MDRSAYLQELDVVDFVHWMEPVVAGDRPIRHGWRSPKWKREWSFETLFDGYRQYEWRFSFTDPRAGIDWTGATLEDTAKVMWELSSYIREAALRNDPEGFRDAAVAIVRWGQVQQNERRLLRMADSLLPRLLDTANTLDPATANLSALNGIEHMNSGFSKIFALLLDGFPIYDSRVACSLASLVRGFCEERGYARVPWTLAFGIPASRGSVSRDPSRGTLQFGRLWPTSARRYAQSNVMAAWLLGALCEIGPFASLDRGRRLLALQSAMFMLGYAPIELPSSQHYRP